MILLYYIIIKKSIPFFNFFQEVFVFFRKVLLYIKEAAFYALFFYHFFTFAEIATSFAQNTRYNKG